MQIVRLRPHGLHQLLVVRSFGWNYLLLRAGYQRALVKQLGLVGELLVLGQGGFRELLRVEGLLALVSGFGVVEVNLLLNLLVAVNLLLRNGFGSF